jgi:hypothetical protein
MMTNAPLLRVASVLTLVAVWSVPAFTHAAPAASPPPSGELNLTAVSDTLADMGRQQAEKGRTYEQGGLYAPALKEYRDAIAGLDRYFDKPSNNASGNPKAFLVRAGAAVDAARALSRMPGHDPAEVRRLAERAESDFTTVLRITRPTDAANRDLIQKATLGRGYARLLRGELQQARTDLQGLKFSQPGATQQVQSAVVRINSDLATSAPKTDKKDKLTVLMNLGQEVVKTFFPKYQGLAVAIGDVADAFKK